MNDTIKRRGRGRTGFAPARLPPHATADAVPAPGMGRGERAACAAVVVIALAMVALIWILTARTVQDQRVELRDRVERSLLGHAATLAETVGHELKLIDQSLTIIQAAWKAGSETVDLLKWRDTMPALMAVADDLFISDEKHIIQQDILPNAVGQGVGAAYVTFPHGGLEQFDTDGNKTREFGQGPPAAVDARQYLMYIIRPLDHPRGWLLGASYRSAELPKLFAQADLGFNAVVALVDTKRGAVQALAGPAARHPNTDLSKSPLYSAIARAGTGLWRGETAIDGVARIHAFHSVPGRDMVVLVGASLSQAMAQADTLATAARTLAVAAAALVIATAGLLLWSIYTMGARQRQHRIFIRSRQELARLRGNEAANESAAQRAAARFDILQHHTQAGVALFDAGLRLISWNPAFEPAIGIPVHRDMPLDVLVRQQAANGLFDAQSTAPTDTGSDIETEIARRVALLRTGDAAAIVPHRLIHGTVTAYGVPTGDGGCMLLLQPATPNTSAPNTSAPNQSAPRTSVPRTPAPTAIAPIIAPVPHDHPEPATGW